MIKNFVIQEDVPIDVRIGRQLIWPDKVDDPDLPVPRLGHNKKPHLKVQDKPVILGGHV